MVDDSIVKQMLIKARSKMTLEEFEKYLKETNRLFSTTFKVDDFVTVKRD